MANTESVKKLLKRIRISKMIEGDGEQFMEYLQELSLQNYQAFKEEGAEMNDVHKGYALCVDFLLESFANCDKEAVLTTQDQLGGKESHS
jgi:hypothetical protein